MRAVLNLDGEELRILNCSYALEQKIDATGRPSAEVRGGTMHFETESTEHTALIEWVMSSWTTKAGSIVFYKRDESKMKELKFEEAYLTHYAEAFGSENTRPMVQTFTISAKKIEMGGAVHENPWPEGT